MKEMRVKGEYIYHDVLYASMGLKIAALDLEDAVAGSQLYVVNTDDQLQDAKVLLQNDFDAVKQKIQLSPTGVGVVASTLGTP
jgi:translation initiation factor 5B